MCAIETPDKDAGAPSRLDLLLQRIARDADAGSSASLTPADVSLLFDLAQEHESLAADFAALKKRYEARTRIERAKELVAEQLGVRMSEAFRLMQKQSSAKNKTLDEIADLILMSDELRQERDRDANRGKVVPRASGRSEGRR